MELLKSVSIHCPYCGELQDVDIDCSIAAQEYIEDCQVCCQPINLAVHVDEVFEPTVEVRTGDE